MIHKPLENIDFTKTNFLTFKNGRVVLNEEFQETKACFISIWGSMSGII
jgi:hypothetical protein